MDSEQQNNQFITPEQSTGMPTTGQASPQPVMSPAPHKSSKKWMILVIVLALLLVGGAAAWYLGKDKDSKDTNQSQVNTQPQDSDEIEEETELKSTTFTSGLEHKSTVTFEHPADWEVTESDITPEGAIGYSLKNMVIASPSGNFLHVFDRDGIGGACDPDTASYTLYKKVTTKTPNMSFKDYDVPSKEFSNHVLILETAGWSTELEAHDALKEGESATNTCNIGGFSTVGASGVFVIVYNSKDDTSAKRLGWDDIKTDPDFVKMLESMVAVDKSDGQL